MDYCVDCMYSCYIHEKSYCVKKNNKEISIFDAPCNDFVSVEDYRKILLEGVKQFAEDTNASDGMEDNETKSLTWHKGEPKKDGEYICKCVDAEAVYMDAGKVDWSEPYYGVYDFYKGLWQCDGAVIAWAEIPECSFELE